MLKIIRRILSIAMLIAGIGMLVWALVPAKRRELVQPIAPVTVSEVDGSVKTVVVIPDYQVVLEWPESLRIGETDYLTLTFEPAPTQANSQAIPSTTVSVYTNNNLMAEFDLRIAGMQVLPGTNWRESLLAGKTIVQKVPLSPKRPGDYRGSVWLSLRILPLSGGTPNITPVFIHDVVIHATSIFGLSGPVARVAGGVGIIIGLVLSYDVMIAFIKITTKDSKDTKVN